MQKEKFEQVVKLRKALANGDIIPYYQPIVDKEGNITKYEALMRVKIDDKIVSPFMFMDLIKEAKLYDEFSKLMIKKVFEDAKSDKLHKVSLNLSFLDISNAEIREFILDLLQKSQIGEKITFEILESESLENINIVTEFIKKVKEFGVTIAIDDFGSGYSNFVNILTIKPDFIKIDGSLIKNIQKPEYYEIVKLINNFAKKFDILTVAEFVENREIFDILIEIGIDCFQGYYFYKPMPFDKIS
jgi:EAL domain-containing protein (putative c-di-GMP-specific phosphodiesterase class I)